MRIAQTATRIALLAALIIAIPPRAHGQDSNEAPANPERPVSDELSQRTIDELIGVIERLSREARELRRENAQLKLELQSVTGKYSELEQFIQDHDTYGPAYDQYQLFVAKREQEERARRAAEREAEREARRQRMIELREEREAARDDAAPDDPLAERAAILRRAGYTRIGDAVFVDEMGTTYRTTTEREVRYSPLLGIYYTDEDEVVDFGELTISGSLVHVGDELHNLSIAVAFYNAQGGQIGQTTVRVNGARPGVPYPFTSELKMASEQPFARYSAWVLSYEPVAAAPADG
ncbi:MAG: FxLYD domain-containing protein [Phycisphaerales bacterium]